MPDQWERSCNHQVPMRAAPTAKLFHIGHLGKPPFIRRTHRQEEHHRPMRPYNCNLRPPIRVEQGPRPEVRRVLAGPPGGRDGRLLLALGCLLRPLALGFASKDLSSMLKVSLNFFKSPLTMPMYTQTRAPECHIFSKLSRAMRMLPKRRIASMALSISGGRPTARTTTRRSLARAGGGTRHAPASLPSGMGEARTK